MPTSKKPVKATLKKNVQQSKVSKPKVSASARNTGKRNRNIVSKQPLLRRIATGVGDIMGGPRLGNLVGDASDYLAKIMGHGDYEVEKNTLLTNNQIPSFSTNGDRVIVKHREYLFDLNSSTAFTNASYLVNPGNTVLFPWLSRIAQNFEEYQFLGLIFEFKSTSADALNSTNTALGTVVFASEYDVLDAQYTEKRQMENTEFCTSTSPSMSMIHPVECARDANVFNKTYVSRATDVASVAGDPRLYFMSNLQIATVGSQAAANIGEVWCSYQVEFTKPAMENLGDVYVPGSYWFGQITSSSLGTPSNYDFGLGLNYDYTGSGASRTIAITFPNTIPLGNYSIEMQTVTNEGLTFIAPTYPTAFSNSSRLQFRLTKDHTGANLVDNNWFNRSLAITGFPGSYVNRETCKFTCLFQITTGNTPIIINVPVLAYTTGTAQCYIRVQKAPSYTVGSVSLNNYRLPSSKVEIEANNSDDTGDQTTDDGSSSSRRSSISELREEEEIQKLLHSLRTTTDVSIRQRLQSRLSMLLA